MVPERIQLRRTKGWKMPENTVKVDRSTRWGNPFRIGDDGVPTAERAVKLFYKLCADPDINASHEFFVFTIGRLRLDLGGKNLACWCPLDEPCHADVLLELANTRGTYRRRSINDLLCANCGGGMMDHEPLSGICRTPNPRVNDADQT